MTDVLGPADRVQAVRATDAPPPETLRRGHGTRRPPVAYILKMYPRFSETFILNEILELEQQGVEVRIFSLKKPDDGRFHADISRVRARVTYAPESPLLAPRAFFHAHREVWRWDHARYVRLLWGVLKRRRMGALKRFLQAGYFAPYIRREGIHHAHAHFATSATSVALSLHRLMGLPYSFTAHAKDIYSDSVRTDVLERKLNAARFAVTVSEYNREHLSALHGGERVVRIYNGLDLARFAPRATAPEDPPLVLAVGRLVEKKGLDDLIHACAVLRRADTGFRCVIVGKGSEERKLRSLIARLELEDCVTLAGPMSREELLAVYPRASVFVAPCVVGADGNRDGLPTVLIEAMALGVPVVSTPVTGIPELVDHKRTGLLVPERDPEALASAIQSLLDDPVCARALALAGRGTVEQRFDLSQNVAELRTLLEQASIRCA